MAAMDVTFPKRLEEAARLVGNAQALAERTGISRRMIGRYLAGRAEPSRDRLVRIADAASVSVEWLATGRGPMLKGSITLDGESKRPVPVENIPLERIKRWLDEWWATADPKRRVWLEVELERHFPELAEWQKKQDPSSKRQSGA